MKYKICVYAICKNEAAFARRWYNSVKEADGVFVLDTGSTDGSAEILRELGATVEEKTVLPWRFDVARNLSLAMVPQDTDICVCCDLDEVFDTGWRQALEEQWQPCTTSASYHYVWSFDEDGNEQTVFNMNKIHALKDHTWRHPVHEVLTYTGCAPTVTHIDGIRLCHYPDNGKSRASYLPLLELAVAEDPRDDRNMHYLGREYYFKGMWDKGISTLSRHLAMPTALWDDERGASMRYIAKCYMQKGATELARVWLYRAIAQTPSTREPYIDMASLLLDQKDYDGVVFMCLEALKITDKRESYITDAACWGALPYDLLSLGYYYTHRYAKALDAVTVAYTLSPNDERIKGNLSIMTKKLQEHSN